MAQPVHLVYCHCAYSDIVPSAVREEVFAGLSSNGVKFHAVADLCESAANKEAMLSELADGRPVRIAACYPRAVRSLLEWAGVAIADLKVLNMRELSASQVLAGMLDADKAPVTHTGETPLPPQPSGNWPPWFPVIDPQRCVQCGQCRNFCLFGVYECLDGKVRVANPGKCKNNCPACARICPAAAIIFPKYPDSPINGDEVRPDDLRRQKMQTNLSSVAEGDIYSMLRSRSPLAATPTTSRADLAKAIQERAKAQQAQIVPATNTDTPAEKQEHPANE